jgi:hypothetical protein
MFACMGLRLDANLILLPLTLYAVRLRRRGEVFGFPAHVVQLFAEGVVSKPAIQPAGHSNSRLGRHLPLLPDRRNAGTHPIENCIAS